MKLPRKYSIYLKLGQTKFAIAFFNGSNFSFSEEAHGDQWLYYEAEIEVAAPIELLPLEARRKSLLFFMYDNAFPEFEIQLEGIFLPMRSDKHSCLLSFSGKYLDKDE